MPLCGVFSQLVIGPAALGGMCAPTAAQHAVLLEIEQTYPRRRATPRGAPLAAPKTHGNWYATLCRYLEFHFEINIEIEH